MCNTYFRCHHQQPQAFLFLRLRFSAFSEPSYKPYGYFKLCSVEKIRCFYAMKLANHRHHSEAVHMFAPSIQNPNKMSRIIICICSLFRHPSTHLPHAQFFISESDESISVSEPSINNFSDLEEPSAGIEFRVSGIIILFGDKYRLVHLHIYTLNISLPLP